MIGDHIGLTRIVFGVCLAKDSMHKNSHEQAIENCPTFPTTAIPTSNFFIFRDSLRQIQLLLLLAILEWPTLSVLEPTYIFSISNILLQMSRWVPHIYCSWYANPSPFALQLTFTNLIWCFQLWKSERSVHLSSSINHDFADIKFTLPHVSSGSSLILHLDWYHFASL